MLFSSAQSKLPLLHRNRRWLRPQSLTLMLVGAGMLRVVPVGAQEPKRPAPVKIGETERASQPNVAPVKVGEAGAAQGKTETAPVKIGETKEEKSNPKTAPVKVGEAAEGEPSKTPDPVKVGDSSEAKSDTAPVTIGDAAPANQSETAPVKVGGAPQAKSDSAPVTIAGASPANRVDVAPVTMKGEAMIEAEFATVAPSSLRVPMLFKQVAAGEAKVEALLQTGALKPDDLVWAVHHPRLWQQKAEVQKAAASTIEVYDAYLARFGDQVADAVNWEPSARAALAAELSRRGDERCVPLFETATAKWVAQWEREGQRKIDGAVPGLHALAWFYQGKDEKLDAAQTYEKSALYSTSPPWVGSALIEAARLYNIAGDKEKSDALYAQVLQYGDGWTSILVLYDRALPLINVGKLEEAKAILSRPLVMTEAITDGRIAQNAWLASLAYRQGDLASALRYGEQVKEAGAGQKLSRDSTKNLYQMGLDVYNRAGGWKNQPIQTDTKQVVFQSNPSQPEAPLYARFRIKTYGDTSITASVDNPNIQARVLPFRASISNDGFDGEVILKVLKPNEVLKNLSTYVALQSAVRVADATRVSISFRDDN